MEDKDLLVILFELNFKVFQPLLRDLLLTIAVNHTAACSEDGDEALKNVVVKYKKKVSACFKNHDKIKCDYKKDTANHWDIPVLIIFLTELEELFPDPKYSGTCEKHNGPECCSSCDHSRPGCEKCRSGSGKPSKSCHHNCKSCKCSDELCGKLCCKTCGRCMQCNKKIHKQLMQHLRSGKPIEQCLERPCSHSALLFALDFVKALRNMFSHTTQHKCKEFLEGVRKFDDFPNTENVMELEAEVRQTVKHIISFVTDSTLFLKILHGKEEYIKENDDRLDKIFSDDKKCTPKELNEILEKVKHLVGSDDLSDIVKKIEDMIEIRREVTSLKKRVCDIEQSMQKDDRKKSKKDREDGNKLVPERISCNCLVLSYEGDVVGSTPLLYYRCVRDEDDDDEEKWNCIEKEDFDIFNDVKRDWSLIKINVSELDSGFTYRFKLTIQNGDDQIDYFGSVEARGEDELDWLSNVISSKTICMAPNTGLEDNIHNFDFEEAKEKLMSKIKKPFEPLLRYKSFTNHEEFREMANEYVKVNVDGNFFPPLHYVRNENMLRLLKSLDAFYKDFTCIVGYDYTKHLDRYGASKECLQELLFEKDVSCHDNSVLFIDKSTNMVTYFRVLKPDVVSSHQIKQEVRSCNDFLKCFLLMNESKIKEQHTGVCSILALTGLTGGELEEGRFCFLGADEAKSLIVSKDDLDDQNLLKRKLEKVLKHVKEHRKSRNAKINREETRKNLNTVAEEAISVMAVTETCLPRFSKDPMIQVVHLFLNKDQFEAINEIDQHLILKGPFGSGKTLILKEIAKRLYFAMENGTIYYICYDPYSLLEVEMVRYFKHLEEEKKGCENDVTLISSNVRRMLQEAGKEDSDSIPDLLECYQKMDGGHDVHFLVDETDGEPFTQSYSQLIKERLSTDNFADSKVVFAMQSTRKLRSNHVTEGSQHEVREFESYCLDQTGMKVLPNLKKCMRMVKDLFELGKVAEEHVQKCSSKIIYETQKKKEETMKKEKPKEEAEEEFSTQATGKMKLPRPNKAKPTQASNKNNQGTKKRLSQPVKSLEEPLLFKDDHNTPPVVEEKLISVTPVRKRATEKPGLGKKVLEDVNTAPLTPLKIEEAREDISTNHEVSKDVKIVSTPSPIKNYEIDQIAKEISVLHIGDDVGLSKHIQTDIRFTDGESGNSIKNDKAASVVYLDEHFSYTSLRSAHVLSIILKEISLLKDLELTIICSNMDEAALVMFCFENLLNDYNAHCYIPGFEGDIPDFATKEEVCKAIENGSILVTDYRSFRGCETEHCITFVNLEEEFTSHVLVEILTRAVTTLDLLVLPSKLKDRRDYIGKCSLFSVLEAWKEKDLLFLPDVEFSTSVGESISVMVEKKEHTVKLSRKDEKQFNSYIGDFGVKQRLRQQDIKKHVYDIIAPHLQDEEVELSEDENHWNDVVFIEKKHFSKILRRDGSKAGKLEQDFSIKLRIQDDILQIAGTKPNKLKALEQLRYMRAEWFDPIDFIPEKEKGIVIGKGGRNLKRMEAAYSVKFKTISGIMHIQGNDENKEKALADIKNKLPSFKRDVDPRNLSEDLTWEDTDVHNCLDKLILNHFSDRKVELGIQLRVDYFTGVLQIQGSRENKAGFKKEVQDFLASRRPDVSLFKEVLIHSFTQTTGHDYQSRDRKLFNRIMNNEDIFEIDYQVNIRIDKKNREFFARGQHNDLQRFKFYIRHELYPTRPLRLTKKIFMIGLSYEDELELKQSERFVNLTFIDRCARLKPVKHFYREIEGLRNEIVKTLSRFKGAMSDGYGEILMRFHLGEMHYTLEPGKHRVINIVEESRNVTRYERLSKNILTSRLSTDKYNQTKESTRYDFFISTPDSELRYKVFIEKDMQGKSQFKKQLTVKQEELTSKQMLKDLRVGPGYFIWPQHSGTRFDIIDPKRNCTMRLNIKAFRSNPRFEESINIHSQILKENFFDKLQIISGTTELVIPEIEDDRYIVSLIRKCDRSDYDVPGTDLSLKISDERLLRDYEQNGRSNDIYDVFIENRKVNTLLDGNDWTVNEVVSEFESVFNLGKDMLREIKDSAMFP